MVLWASGDLGQSRKVFIELWWSLGGMKNKGNTHQDRLHSTVSYLPMFEVNGENPPVFQLLPVSGSFQMGPVHLQAATM